MADYTRSWDETSPADTDKAGKGAEEIRHFKEDIKERYNDVARGEKRLSWENLDNSSLPNILGDSWIEIAGQERRIASKITTTDSGATSGAVYIKVIDSSGTITAEVTETAPTWNNTYFGWYGTGASANHRYVLSLTKDGSSYAEEKEYDGKEVEANTKISYYSSQTGAGTQNYDPYIFEKKIYDTKNEYDTSTGIMTVDKSGYYRISAYIATISSDTNTSGGKIGIEINGVVKAVATNWIKDSSSTYLSHSIVKEFYIERGDTVKITFYRYLGAFATTEFSNGLSISEI